MMTLSKKAEWLATLGGHDQLWIRVALAASVPAAFSVALIALGLFAATDPDDAMRLYLMSIMSGLGAVVLGQGTQLRYEQQMMAERTLYLAMMVRSSTKAQKTLREDLDAERIMYRWHEVHPDGQPTHPEDN